MVQAVFARARARAPRLRALRLTLLLSTALQVSCGLRAEQLSAQPSAAQARRAAPSDPRLEPLALLPSGAQRCSAVVPARVAADERPLAALVSQSEPLPWALTLEVEAYERGERVDGSGRRAVVEALRFVEPARERIEAELARIFGQQVEWRERVRDEGASCEGELTCLPIRGHFVDPRTVLLTRGQWGEETESDPGCRALLARHPDVFEVSARTFAASGTEVTRSELLIRREPDGFARESRKYYADPGSAERVLQSSLAGHDELPLFAGVSAASFGLRRGSAIEQRSFVTLDELELSLADRARLTRAQQTARTQPPAAVDPHDLEAVKASVDAQRARLRTLAESAARRDEVLALDTLLRHARSLAAGDEGLLRRHYELQLELLHAPPAALATAEEALRLGAGDTSSWQLRVRAALAHIDEARLRQELLRAHGLPKEVAQRMARELARQAQLGGDHERAEWAFLSARQLAAEGSRARRAPLALRLPLSEVGRLFGYLGRSDASGDIGVQVLALSSALEPRADSLEREGPWRAETSGAGRRGLMVAATTWDDAQLVSLGGALLEGTAQGAVELFVAVEQLGTSRRTTLALSGERVGAELVLDSASRSLARLHWPRIERLLLAPLRRLTGATYPPDALVVAAAEPDEAVAIAAAAQREPRVRCASEGLVVTCRGALADQGAAPRALLQVARVLLAADGRSVWSHGE